MRAVTPAKIERATARLRWRWRAETERRNETLEPLPDKGCFDVSDRNGETGEQAFFSAGDEAEDDL